MVITCSAPGCTHHNSVLEAQHPLSACKGCAGRTSSVGAACAGVGPSRRQARLPLRRTRSQRLCEVSQRPCRLHNDLHPRGSLTVHCRPPVRPTQQVVLCTCRRPRCSAGAHPTGHPRLRHHPPGNCWGPVACHACQQPGQAPGPCPCPAPPIWFLPPSPPPSLLWHLLTAPAALRRCQQCPWLWPLACCLLPVGPSRPYIPTS